MPNLINADNGVVSGFAGVRTTADGTGNLALQSNGVTLMTLATNNTVTISGTTSQTGNASFGNVTATAFNGAIGGTTPAAGAFTTLAGTGAFSVTGARSTLTANSETYSLGLRYNSSGGYCYIGATNSAGPDIVFSNGSGTELGRFTTSGNLLVGRTTVYSDGSIGAPAIQSQSTNGARSALACIADTTSTLNVTGYVNPNGYVGGVFTSGSSTIYNTSSDYRLKENITPISNALESVAKLKPVDYTWKVDSTKGQGFIAHELQEVCPQAVTGTKDEIDEEGKPKYQGIDTSFLVAMLTKAIQELNAKVDAQAAKIAALEAKL